MPNWKVNCVDKNQNRSSEEEPISDQTDKEFISKVRFEPCFEQWVEFGWKENNYLGGEC